MPVLVTRRAQFSAAHRLFNPAFSDARNTAVFDKCNNVHGHNYVLEVTVAGTPAEETGYVIDLKVLERLMDEAIVRHVDHRNLNVDVPMVRGRIPTAENLVLAFWDALAPHLPGGALHRIRLWESENNSVEYYGPAR